MSAHTTQRVTVRTVNLQHALHYAPFEGDETDVTPLSDKIVRAAKSYRHCQCCHGPIEKGENHRARAERNNEDRTLMTFRWCNKCTRAQAYPNDDAGRLLDSRYRIGEWRRRNEREAQWQSPT